MSSSSQFNPISIPFRKIICKSCQTVGSTETGFKIFDSEVKDRALAVCDSCGASNLIRKERI
ncbi:MAG: hypothetical protein ACD_47C00072G0002 [uncultured bacterium]|uniref:Uncharacterized protein n=1 Tax=Candidatus Wallbacteria bacterium GWC2_49_35 TaxID=1817813 RepID=A0A1F7X0I8_9BACT|nr:MAG: hypothetical protein ACD_47C00072G0002 [uncultured bacterium]OGM08592.1 MAG: hypothetical protein A2008_09265 [Candidatus Wallbacteria bacterium GWC2_49_35]HBC74708.1 hypothetical protein [Candidatus Wallbacteria bacterium]